MATAALVVTAIAAVGGAIQQRKISKAQKKQNKIQNRIAAITRRRNVKRAIAASRIQVAEQQAVGFQLGVAGGTAVEGAVAGRRTDIATAIQQSNIQFTGQEAIADLADRISGFQSVGATFGAIQNIAGSFAGGAGTTGAQSRAAVSEFFGFEGA